jgi:hypothetical protein
MPVESIVPVTPPAIPCEKCRSAQTVVTDVTTYGHYFRCASCRHTWYAQTSAFRYAD